MEIYGDTYNYLQHNFWFNIYNDAGELIAILAEGLNDLAIAPALLGFMIYGLGLSISIASIGYNAIPALINLLNSNDKILQLGSGFFVLSSLISVLLLINKVQII